MKSDESIAFNPNILNVIPKDVLGDVPKHKKDELCRGVLLYLSKEMPELYQNCPKNFVSNLQNRFESLLN